LRVFETTHSADTHDFRRFVFLLLPKTFASLGSMTLDLFQQQGSLFEGRSVEMAQSEQNKMEAAIHS
jgi:hypothetical protein